MTDKLEEYRAEIDRLDRELIDILAQRIRVVEAVGRLKAQTGMQVVQAARAEEVKRRNEELAAQKGIKREFVRRFYEMLIDYAHELEDEIIAQGREKHDAN
ncbi:MAG: chorismate mutase [Alphaproteobacteria bacterium]|nr:chorismate mutase [Alphaproteobacteria bacterium]